MMTLINSSNQNILKGAQRTDIVVTNFAVQCWFLFIKVRQSFTKVTFETPSYILHILWLFNFLNNAHFMIVRTFYEFFVELFTGLAKLQLLTEYLYCLIRLFPIITNETKQRLFLFQNCKLRKGDNLILLIDLLIDNIPNINIPIHMWDDSMCEQII